MMIQSLRKTREFTGPTPHSVAILAKPKNKLPVEQIILERRKYEEIRNKTIQETIEQEKFDLKSEWEKASEKKLRKNIISRRVEAQLQREKFSLEERRDQLRQLLIAEEEQYLEEMEANEESIEDRQEKMRQRANELRAKREAERQALVAEKLDQKFRDECEELRSIVSHRQRDELFKERQTQLAEKAVQQQQENEIKQMYAELWEQDRLAKAQKEELEAQEQMKRNREMVEILNIQKAGFERKKEEERQFKQYEAEWLKQEAAIRAEEDKFLADERKRKQMAARRNREISTKLKDRKEAKEKQEQLAMDMRILQKAIEDTRNEEIEDKNRKKILRDENQRFMHYVEMTRKEEKERQERFASIVNDEVEKQYARRDEKKEREKAARQALLQNVLITRREQVKEKDETRKKEQEEALQQRQELLQQIEEYKRLEAEQIEKLRVKNKTYQEDLVEQIKFQRKKNDREIEEARREMESFKEAEKNYQRKLKSAIDRPERTHRQHPFRVDGIGFTARAKSS